MPGTSRSTNPRNIEIFFEEESHKYWSTINGRKVNYVSGTSFLGRFYPQFDPDGKIAARCAAKEGISVEALKERWAAKGRESCRLGTRTHELCEDIELGRQIRNTPEDEAETLRFSNATKLANKLKATIDILGVEKIIFSDRLPTPIAGTIDLLGRSRKNGSYLVLDWKTNQDISQDNPYHKFCLDPISHLPDVSFYHYALQLSLYQYLLTLEGYVKKDVPFQRALLHVTDKDCEIIPVPDLTSEVKDLLIWNEMAKAQKAITTSF